MTLEPDERVPLAAYTTMHVGGPARFMARPRNPMELKAWLTWADERGLPWLILGEGSNVLIADHGFDGLVIINRRQPAATDFVVVAVGDDVHVRVDAGESLAALVRWSVMQGLTGLEWAAGIPGTIGGALAGNAGAFGGSMADVVVSAEIGWESGDSHCLSVTELNLTYRRCELLRADESLAVLWVIVGLKVDRRIDCQARVAEHLQRRRDTQPGGYSAGSIFRNPEGKYAGALIERCGLKGVGVGGAFISERHANFIINCGNATTADVLTLMNRARRAVLQRFGVLLEPEVRLIGDIGLEEL